MSEWSQVHCCVNENRPHQTYLQPPSCSDSETTLTGQCSIPQSGKAFECQSPVGLLASHAGWTAVKMGNGPIKPRNLYPVSQLSDRVSHLGQGWQQSASKTCRDKSTGGWPPSMCEDHKKRRFSVRQVCITPWNQSLFAHVGASVQVLQMCESYGVCFNSDWLLYIGLDSQKKGNTDYR